MVLKKLSPFVKKFRSFLGAGFSEDPKIYDLSNLKHLLLKYPIHTAAFSWVGLD